MEFDLKTWQGKIKEGLKGWRERMQKSGVKSIYAFVSATAIWPVIQVASGGQWTALTQLGMLTAGVGTSLLAGRLQKWKDEADAARQIEDEVVNNKDFRDELDIVLDKLNVISLAKEKLSEAEKQWFIGTLRDELKNIGNLEKHEAWLKGPGAIAQGENAKAVGDHGLLIESGGHTVIAGSGANVVIEGPSTKTERVDFKSVLDRYLGHIIALNRYLQLQGIRSGGRIVHIELDQIYITLRTTQRRTRDGEDIWLEKQSSMAPGELSKFHREHPKEGMETVSVSVNEALARHRRLVVLGDPGSGKTTLLRYLTLIYAQDFSKNEGLVKDKLGLGETGYLPILLPLRKIGDYLGSLRAKEDGTEGHVHLLDYLIKLLKNERIVLPDNFFGPYLESGNAVILFDGLDEVADSDLRRRVSRLVDSFTRAFPKCRFVVTSRIVGYTGNARLVEEYATTTVREFTMEDIKHFLSHWHRLVAIGQMGRGAGAEAYAEKQTIQLYNAINNNERIRDLAINPLMLTVIALVHREHVKLPDRRAELYAESIDVLLGKWEEAKGIHEDTILQNKPFDTSDKRHMLQNIALYMHEKKLKEIGIEELRKLIRNKFGEILIEKNEIEKTVSRFLMIIEERTGLLIARGEGIYTFSHLTFQEYLSALAIAGKDDYVEYTLECMYEPWWREVVLLEAGYLSIQSKERTTRLVRAIADHKRQPEPYHNLVLAAECIRDVGGNRIEGGLERQIQYNLRKELDSPPPFLTRMFKKYSPKGWIERKSIAVQAMARAGAGFWKQPYGEPEWADIPAGEFWMGSFDEIQMDKLKLDHFMMSKVPITNAQYYLFVKGPADRCPPCWEDGRPQKGKESHPVVRVSWFDAMAYCEWLSKMTGKSITLPSEAQWEKAARGDKDRREYPWGDKFDSVKCNSNELGLNDTTPVGIFQNGASPYGVLDMSGNVWELTRSLYKEYPYGPNDGREDIDASEDESRVLRGGAFDDNPRSVRCASRNWYAPDGRNYSLGFRVVLSPF